MTGHPDGGVLELCPHPQEHAMTAPEQDGSHDFDFLIGAWRVRHRRLRERLAGDTRWEEFDGTSVFRPLMAGQAHVDDNLIELPAGSYRAVSLRSYDPRTRQWAIWWLDARHPHRLDVPVVGGFENGVGRFEADDSFGGMPIRVRFEWSHITPTSARWQQAFSPDAGQTWETNWVMDFTRTG